MSSNSNRKSFGIRCSLCGTVAESWHAKFRQHAPPGATIGMASCKCGSTVADASEVPGKGRLIVGKPKADEQ
jgi:hypothetical protein